MINIDDMTILKLQEEYDKKQFTCRELVLHYLSKILEVDKCQGGLNSVLELNPDALFIADNLDKMRANGKRLGALHGVPILLKDNINTKDKMHTSAGSIALEDNFAPYDAHIVKLLRQAGALILGKTNMTEFANSITTGMPDGYSSRGGQTLCPYDKNVDPSGSSTGSAVAVSAHLCLAAVGTETCGSIIAPSQRNGIVGIKPTLGLLSRRGIIPASITFDTAGSMGRCVTDAAILLEAMVGSDNDDPATGDTTDTPINYLKNIDSFTLKGVRIGIDQTFANGLDTEKRNLFDMATQLLADQGAECVMLSNLNVDNSDKIRQIEQCEFKCAINHYLASRGSNCRIQTLEDMIRYNQSHAERAIKYGQTVFVDVQENTSGNLTEPEYMEGMIEREKLIQNTEQIFAKNNIDAIFTLGGIVLAAYAGFPSMAIPLGFSAKNHLPIGSHWIAKRFNEKSLIDIGYAFEQVLKAQKYSMRTD